MGNKKGKLAHKRNAASFVNEYVDIQIHPKIMKNSKAWGIKQKLASSKGNKLRRIESSASWNQEALGHINICTENKKFTKKNRAESSNLLKSKKLNENLIQQIKLLKGGHKRGSSKKSKTSLFKLNKSNWSNENISLKKNLTTEDDCQRLRKIIEMQKQKIEKMVKREQYLINSAKYYKEVAKKWVKKLKSYKLNKENTPPYNPPKNT